MQPIENKEGVMRFKPNEIVRHLLNHGQKCGCGLNQIACMNFSKEDHMQLAQLIGYSVSGYKELDYVNDSSGAAEKISECESEDASTNKTQKLTPTVKRILKLAEIEAEKDKSFVGVIHILIGMMLEGDNYASLNLRASGFTVECLRKASK